MSNWMSTPEPGDVPREAEMHRPQWPAPGATILTAFAQTTRRHGAKPLAPPGTKPKQRPDSPESAEER